MIYVSAALVVATFVFCFERLGVTRSAGRAIATSRAAGPILRDPTRSDDEKEAALRAASLSLVGNFGSILVRGAATLALAALPAAVLGLAGVADFEETMRWLASWEAIIGITVLVTLYYLLLRRR